ncbi:hypothetical protein GWI33_022277 [Rhynchophorus ferrugineus]|uniref:DALR anticodon binding domain-containing protein n=1 Tax=Rhynchophorus ferrugineus TaxID=354439 RepID=A0A834IND6_RHYFE|nr:hypothetical protein GWI33_022277 [Rhynchophorus ferrugineus]
MSPLDIYIVHLYKTLIDVSPESNQTIVKLHTKYLEELGDISFPLLRKSWLSVLPASYNIEIISEEDIDNNDLNVWNLSILRLSILKKVADNLIKLTTSSAQHDSKKIYIGLNKKQNFPFLVVGPVMNQKGVKDTTNSAMDLINKRASDMRMMAQHRYQVNIKADSDYREYFHKLGVSSVTIELLSNKPHKPIKVMLNGSSNVNKGPSFIFYNCARISVLLKEFQRKVDQSIYTQLPNVEEIDVTLLNQPEEWEIYYGYVLQFPILIKNCIKDIEKEIFSPQNLITFLSNLSGIFSVYYRRVRILTDPREHLLPLIHARIYLIKTLHQIIISFTKLATNNAKILIVTEQRIY